MNIISQIFKDKKSLPLNTFIDRALYHERYGYYSKKNPLGLKGDFVTSPLVSELFGEMLGIYIIDYWKNYINKNFTIIELGPGKGTMLKDLIFISNKFQAESFLKPNTP